MWRILIVDDDRHVCQQLRKLLSTFQYSSGFILQPELLFPRLEQSAFDLILLDINLPRLNGLTLLKQLKAHPEYQKIPVVMLTGESEEQWLAACLEYGAVDFVQKPLKREILQARLRSALATYDYIHQTEIQKEHYRILVNFLDSLLERQNEIPLLLRSEQFLMERMDAHVVFWEMLAEYAVPIGRVDRDVSPEKCREVLEHGASSEKVSFEGKHPKYVRHANFIMEILEAGRFDQWPELLPLYVKNIYIALISYRQHRTLLQTQSSLAMKNAEMERDIQLAVEVQQAILPELPELSFLKHLVIYQPYAGTQGDAAYVSGDVYEASLTQDGGLDVFLGDATGHGVSAALITMIAQVGLRSLSHDLPTPEIIRQLNSLLMNSLSSDKYMTGVYLRIHTNGVLKCCNAGHYPILILPSKGKEIVVLSQKGVALGLFLHEVVPYQEEEYFLKPGDKIVIFTDGIVEWENQEGQFFGMQRVLQFFQTRQALGLQQLMDHLLSVLSEFAQGQLHKDDVTVLMFEYCG